MVDNIYYFKIYKLLADNKCEIKHYGEFYEQVNQVVTKKSDNIRMMLANCKVQIAKIHEQYENYYDSAKCL